MNRSGFQLLARTRIQESRALLRQGHWPGAYYLSGYAVECGLKACIAKQTRKHDFPSDPSTIRTMYTHNVEQLVKVAGLQPDQAKEAGADPVFAVNWAIVKDWSEQSRYEYRSQQEAEDLYGAIADRSHGVLRWIRRYW